MDSDIGKNDGSYAGIRYFNCKSKFGLFVPMHRIRKESWQNDKKKKKKLVKTRDSMITTSLAIEAQSEIQMSKELQVCYIFYSGTSAILSTVERLSSSQRSRNVLLLWKEIVLEHTLCTVLSREVVLFSEVPL